MKLNNFFKNLKKEDSRDQTNLINVLNEKIANHQQQLTKYINKFLQNEEKWRLINNLIQSINSTLEMEDLSKLICFNIVRLVGSDICSVYEYDKKTQKLKLQYTDAKANSEELSYMKGFIREKNIFVNKFINVNLDICSNSITSYLNENLSSKYHIAPIVNNSNLFGIIFIYKESEEISSEEMNILQIITENLIMTMKNAELYEKVKQSNKNKVEFIATLSHEFKTPLNTIIGFTDIIRSDDDLEKQQINKYAENILNCSNHLLKLIEDIQDVSIAESGNINLYYEKFNFKTLINDCICQLEGLIKKKDLEIITQLMDMPINADIKRLRQVIYNLFSNAIKFSNPNGKIKVVSYVAENSFHFEITNHGKIIEPCERTNMFKLFYQSCPSTRKKYEGAGIGLALCKKIVDLHSGEIDYSSSEENGTTFWFSLPISNTTGAPAEMKKK